MYFQKLHQFFSGRSVGGEAVGVLEDAAANHETVDGGVLGVELEGVGAVFDVAVDDELGGGAEIVTEIGNIRNKLVVGGDFAHFFAGAEMNGEGGRVLGEEDGEPGLIFIGRGPTEAGFDRYREIGAGAGIMKAFDGEVGSVDHGGTTAGFVDMAVGAAEVEINAGKAEAF